MKEDWVDWLSRPAFLEDSNRLPVTYDSPQGLKYLRIGVDRLIA